MSKPLSIGIFGGSFNPIHLGHALLAITTQQTKSVDEVVLVPVYKHAVKRNLLPFEDRVEMCRLAIESFGSALSVSTIEEEVGASNGAMIRALKAKYPPDTKFYYICGDDFVRWMHKPKGIESIQEVSGVIIQRRLHKQASGAEDSTSRFLQEPLDEEKLSRLSKEYSFSVDYIYGELPHFSSSLVRQTPGQWRSFLTQRVVQYLDERPHLLQQLHDDLKENDTASPAQKKTKIDQVLVEEYEFAGTCVLQALDVVQELQMERGRTALYLSTGQYKDAWKASQTNTDAQLQKVKQSSQSKFCEVSSLVAELGRVNQWLSQDRQILNEKTDSVLQMKGTDGWLARWSLVKKFNSRVDVLIQATVTALAEVLEHLHQGKPQFATPDLLLKWCDGKESLGRLRAFVCAAGPEAPNLIRSSLELREMLHQRIDTKDRGIAQVLQLQKHRSSTATPAALHKLLENVNLWEYRILGSFVSSTPLPLVHKCLETPHTTDEFDVERFFDASTAAIDFLLTFAKALAASACASG